MVAASMGKYSQSKEELGSIWDRLKSIMNCFALNLSQQIKHQKEQNNIPLALFITHEFKVPAFLQMVELCPVEIWFHPHGMAADFAQRLSAVNAPRHT